MTAFEQEIMQDVERSEQMYIESEITVMRNLMDAYIKAYNISSCIDDVTVLEQFSIIQEADQMEQSGDDDKLWDSKRTTSDNLLGLIPRILSKILALIGSILKSSPSSDESINRVNEMVEASKASKDPDTESVFKEIDEEMIKAAENGESWGKVFGIGAATIGGAAALAHITGVDKYAKRLAEDKIDVLYCKSTGKFHIRYDLRKVQTNMQRLRDAIYELNSNLKRHHGKDVVNIGNATYGVHINTIANASECVTAKLSEYPIEEMQALASEWRRNMEYCQKVIKELSDTYTTESSIWKRGIGGMMKGHSLNLAAEGKTSLFGKAKGGIQSASDSIKVKKAEKANEREEELVAKFESKYKNQDKLGKTINAKQKAVNKAEADYNEANQNPAKFGKLEIGKREKVWKRLEKELKDLKNDQEQWSKKQEISDKRDRAVELKSDHAIERQGLSDLHQNDAKDGLNEIANVVSRLSGLVSGYTNIYQNFMKQLDACTKVSDSLYKKCGKGKWSMLKTAWKTKLAGKALTSTGKSLEKLIDGLGGVAGSLADSASSIANTTRHTIDYVGSKF